MKFVRPYVCVAVVVTLILCWEYSRLTSDDIKYSKSLENQPRYEMKPAKFTTYMNTSGSEIKLHIGSQNIRGISKEVQNFQELAAIFQTPWKANTSNVRQLRNGIAKSIYAAEMVLTQSNVQPFENISYASGDSIRKLSTEFYNMLPKASPFQRMYKRCSVVGNGGILRGSKCGNEIDRSDFVIRCNAPPIHQFSDDVGVKSNVTTVNPSIIIKKFGLLRQEKEQSLFIKSMQQYVNYIWFPIFRNGYSYKPSLKANYQIYHQSPKHCNNSVKVLNGNPNHFRRINRYWKKIANFRKVLSSGFYFATSAVLLCEEIHLYGFWPFYTDIHNRPLSYHYYENATLVKYAHEFGKEFMELIRLHRDGILQLHVDKYYP
ncbi:alpha-N-acetylneuraminide alpha-2,8-sialyltransferase-like isoform X2 [Anneissia japonica]|uniref:alpha-N-acetylneuraminide alpha-2,8-sialyltransferase-like isoform X2 n=1 Tax=Anneissia japonica TaxID=1529436 RepID=UPI001425B107|nr:alpha-N-acetylneuraminide alpha-2,8-sialyltransferase-like isoform X2 [Anneissia japonica]